MLIIICIVSLIIILLVLNEIYFRVVVSQDYIGKMISSPKNKKYDYAAFGSTYCKYAISFDGINGFNYGMNGQFLYYTNLVVRTYLEKCVKKNGVVYLIIADMVFAEEGKGLYHPERYLGLVPKSLLGDEYSIFKFLFYYRMPLLFNPLKIVSLVKHLLVGNTVNERDYNILNDAETRAAAKKRCESWMNQFGFHDLFSVQFNNKVESNIEIGKKTLSATLTYCKNLGYRPILVVTPVCSHMREMIGVDFINKILFDNIKAVNNDYLFLNYFYDNRFKDSCLYDLSGDCLNKKGRKMFTEILLKDTQIYESGNIDIS